MTTKATFAEFFYLWASEVQRWDVPAIHWRIVHWLEHRGKLAVLRVFRGAGKSTLLALYNAWRFYDDPTYRILHQGDQDKTAYKTSRDTRSVLMRHPLTRDSFRAMRGEASFWWVPGAVDERNPSMQAAGITSNITSSRCDEAQNDDVEVPRNITNPENREKMRYRLGEQVHCMVPGARRLFVGTPHTHDSLYDEYAAMGADCLTIPMFKHEFRIESARGAFEYELPFTPQIVLSGIGKHAKALREGVDYSVSNGKAVVRGCDGLLVDFYGGSAWPERFTLEEMEKRRTETRTINEWDSQYQLHSKPVHQTRLDPKRLIAYNVEPTFITRNKHLVMLLGDVQIVGAAVQWDPSAAKVNSDVSALAVVLQDELGNRYWHRAIALTGEVAEFDPRDNKTIVGGQVHQICQVVRELQLRSVRVETNGAGTFAPQVLITALKQQQLHCGVTPFHETRNKNKTILEALEPPLVSGKLWAHVSVLDAVIRQMREWNPAVTQQPDDYLDSGAKAVLLTPERVGHLVRTYTAEPGHDWRPNAGVFEAELEL